jgi:CheY-like chemotaxis protein
MRRELESEKRTLSQAYVAIRPVRILLADDDVEMRDLLARVLRADGYEVWPVRDGAALLDVIEKAPRLRPVPEVVISDVRMPGRSGMEVLAHLRTNHFQTPVILISAFADDALHEEADRLGARMLDKPFDLERLREAVLELGTKR